MEDYGYIKENYTALCEELAALAARLGTKAARLVCVTKSGSDDEVRALVRAGALELGENRPQEAARRAALLESEGLSVKMHEIGTLQRNKIRLIADSVYMIQSIDSLKLAEDVSRIAAARGRRIPVLAEINSGREPQKSGVFPEAAEELLSAIRELPAIELRGLMTMGPATENAEELRPYFRETRALFERCTRYFEKGTEPVLSMGMSDSYRVAIEEGSTLVRVGRKLFMKRGTENV